MLPTSTLERLAATRGLRFTVNPAEKRDALRLPLRIPGYLHFVEHRMILAPIRVVLKDISLSGVGILLPRLTGNHPNEWVVWTGLGPATSDHSLVLACQSVRATDAGPTLRLLGGRITALLAPGQRIVPGRLLPGYDWIPTLTDTPPDPLAPDAAPHVAPPLRSSATGLTPPAA